MMALFAMTSCEEPTFIYTPDNECLTFSTNKASWLYTDDPVVEIEVEITRGVVKNELSLPLTLTGDALFSLTTASPLTFAAGEASKTIKVGYDITQAQAGESYTFTLSFDKEKVSPAGWNEFVGTLTMPGGASSEFVDYATVEFYQGKINSCVRLEQELHSLLQVSKLDPNKYRIKNAMNSGIDLDFTIDGDGVVHLSNEPTLCPFDNEQYIKIPSSIEYEGETITFWIDQNPKYNKIAENAASGDHLMGMTADGGTSITWYVWMETASKGILKFTTDDDGWWRMYYDVVNMNPKPDPDLDYDRLGKVEFYQGKVNSCVTSEAVLHSLLLVSKYDANSYRIKNAMNSGIDLDFTIDSEEKVHLTNATTLCPFDNAQYIKIPSTVLYEGEPITFWIDPDPKYNKIAENAATGDHLMGMTTDGGTSITWYVWMETASKGILKFTTDDDGWWRMYYDVTEVYL